ncbi:MAG: response regulator, partial [Chitinophagaceae bacterium]
MALRDRLSLQEHPRNMVAGNCRAKFPHFQTIPPPNSSFAERQSICKINPNSNYQIMTNQAALPAKDLKKVLIIEDEGEMCLLLNILLDGKEMELDHVKNLKSAEEYLKSENPSVVILDNKLPDGFGVDFINHIKANYPGIKIIMISGYGASAKDVAL